LGNMLSNNNNNNNNNNNIQRQAIRHELSPLVLSCLRIPLVQREFTAHLAVGGLLVFPSSKEKISQLGIELPTPPFGFGCLSIIIR
jgi:hypothetical protein